MILDKDDLYDPAHFDDRLLLGLKGTMSEAELHVLKARLQGGILNKARRGELITPLPIGFCYGPEGQVLFDPDREVQGLRNHRQVLFKGGTTQKLFCPLPPPIAELRKNPAQLVAEVVRLLDDYTHGQMEAILTHKGKRTVRWDASQSAEYQIYPASLRPCSVL